MQKEEYYDKMLEAYVAKPNKVQWYKDAFAKYEVDGKEKMVWHWSWWGFGGGFLFLLYRKAYFASLILFVLTIFSMFIPFIGGFLSMILSGGYATFFLYRDFTAKRKEIEENIKDDQQRINAMRVLGGYNQWVVWVYGFFFVTIFVGIVAALMIPQLVS